MQGNKTQDGSAHLCNQDKIQSTKKGNAMEYKYSCTVCGKVKELEFAPALPPKKHK